MELRQLEYFEAVSRLRSFTKAAAELHVSQPAITTAIKNLEEELGMALLVRDKRSVMLTWEGEVLRGKARDLLERFDQVVDDMREMKDSNEWVVNIGITPITGSFLNGLLYGGFSRECPKARFKVLELGSLGIQDAVDADEIDIGFLVLQENAEEKYDVRRIQKGVLKVLVHRDNPLSARDKLSAADLKDQKLIHLPEHSYIRKKLDIEFGRCGVSPEILAVPQQMVTLFNLVENNVGVSFALGDGYSLLIPREHIVSIPLDPPIYYETGFVWKKGRRIGKAARLCISYVEQHAREYC